MSGINPFTTLLSLFSGQLAQGTLPAQPSQVISLPSGLQNLTTPQQIKGTVINYNATDNMAVIATPKGEVMLKIQPSMPLPIGTKLDLQIPAGRDISMLNIRPLTLKDAPNQVPSNTRSTLATTDTVQTNTASNTAQRPDVQTLQQTATQARTAIQQNGLPQQQTLSLQTGQTIRLTPLPADLQSMTAIRSQFQMTEAQQIQTLLSPAVSSTVQASVSSSQPAIFPRQLIDMLLNIRPQITPDTVTYQVSGNRTPRPVTTMPPALPQPAPEMGLQISTQMPVRNNTSATSQDARINTMVEPMHIRPPVVTTATVSMAASLPMAQGLIQNQPQFMTLFNSFAGDSMTLTTGYVTEDGNPVVQMLSATGKSEFYTINYPARSLPSGTFLILGPLNTSAASGIQIGTDSPQNALMPLIQSMPAATAQSMMAAMPSSHNAAQFPVAALLFLAAATGGDLSGWLGNRNARALESTPKSQLRDMLQDLLSAGKGRQAALTDPQPVQSGDWRGHQIPLVGHDGTLTTAMLWVKDDATQKNDNEASQDTAKRFLLDLHLSRMGTVHFDGLVHPSRKTLDLAFATQRPLTNAMEDRLNHLWLKTLEGLGYSGSLSFKIVRK